MTTTHPTEPILAQLASEPARTPSVLVRSLLLAELMILFVFGPALCAWFVEHRVSPFVGTRWLFPALWIWFTFCLTLLLIDRKFEKRSLWRRSQVTLQNLRPMFLRFTLLAAGIAVCVAAFAPDMLLSLPRRAPIVWIFVMIGYPIVSVFAQEVIFRAFFVHRYTTILPQKWAMILVNALVFGWVHIVFLNWLAVAMCVVGGAIFCHTYMRTKSVALASIEHALYGCFVFTIGLGQFFYAGAINT